MESSWDSRTRGEAVKASAQDEKGSGSGRGHLPSLAVSRVRGPRLFCL
jgi:hypothetical protein